MDQDKPSAERPTTEPVLPAADPGVRLDRRSLIRVGAGAAPVLLSLASTPVAAGNCVVASSFVSVATFKSRNPTTTSIQCTGYNVEYWRAKSPKPSVMSSYTVGSWLLPTTSSYNSLKLVDVIAMPTATTGELGVLQHLIALSLCCHSGYVSNISKAYLADIWANYKRNGSYKLASMTWDEQKLVGWMRYLMYTNPI